MKNKIELRHMLAQDKTEEVIDELIRIELDDNKLYSEIIAISGRYQLYEREKRNGLIDLKDLDLKLNNIRHSLLEIIGILPDEDLKEKTIFSFIQSKASKNVTSIVIFLLVAILFLVLKFALINIQGNNNNTDVQIGGSNQRTIIQQFGIDNPGKIDTTNYVSIAEEFLIKNANEDLQIHNISLLDAPGRIPYIALITTSKKQILYEYKAQFHFIYYNRNKQSFESKFYKEVDAMSMWNGQFYYDTLGVLDENYIIYTGSGNHYGGGWCGSGYLIYNTNNNNAFAGFSFSCMGKDDWTFPWGFPHDYAVLSYFERLLVENDENGWKAFSNFPKNRILNEYQNDIDYDLENEGSDNDDTKPSLSNYESYFIISTDKDKILAFVGKKYHSEGGNFIEFINKGKIEKRMALVESGQVSGYKYKDYFVIFNHSIGQMMLYTPIIFKYQKGRYQFIKDENEIESISWEIQQEFQVAGIQDTEFQDTE